MPSKKSRAERRREQQQGVSQGGFSIPPVFKARKGKLSGGLVALSSAAIIAVYTIGRAASSSASGDINVDIPTALLAQNPTLPPSTSLGANPPTATSPGQATAVPATTYRDGTYTGSGNSRHGGMDVTVQITGGQITSANVVSCYTRYSCSYMDPLAGEAVSLQGVPSKHVSGATDSSNAFKEALAAALEQALVQ